MGHDHEHGPPSVDPAIVNRIVYALYAICGLFVLVDIVAWFTHVPFHKHGHYDWELIPGFHAAYGFVACVLLMLAATELRKLVMRDEDYYDG